MLSCSGVPSSLAPVRRREQGRSMGAHLSSSVGSMVTTARRFATASMTCFLSVAAVRAASRTSHGSTPSIADAPPAASRLSGGGPTCCTPRCLCVDKRRSRGQLALVPSTFVASFARSYVRLQLSTTWGASRRAAAARPSAHAAFCQGQTCSGGDDESRLAMKTKQNRATRAPSTAAFAACSWRIRRR